MSTSTRDSLVAQLDETWDSIDAVLGGLTDDQWRLPTSCPGWTVADQVAHLIGTESSLAGRPTPPLAGEPGPHVRNDIGRFNEAWIVEFRRRSPAEVLAAWREITALRRSQLEAASDDDFAADSWTPVGPGTYGRFMEIRVFDTWVHEQDIREAVGRPGHQHGAAVDRSFAEITGALGYVVGKRAGAPDGSRITFQLQGPAARVLHVAVGGRARVVSELEGPPDVTLTMPALTFARLACGRVDPDTVLADGSVAIAGDVGLGRRVATNLAFTI
jgi:uncharacterized protein (TIGR03083 family)